VNARWFWDARHAEIFSVLSEIAHNGGGDFVVAAIRLRERRKLDGIGGLPYLGELQNAVPSAENLEFYLPELRHCVERRAVLDAATRLQQLAEDPTVDATAVVADAEAALQWFRHTTDAGALPEITDASTLVGEPMEAPKELVSGILHQGSKLVLGGGSKSFKTWSLIDLALSVSHGEPWFSFKTGKGRVIYLNMELPPWAFRQRIIQVATAKSIELIPGQLSVWNLRGKAAAFDVLFPKIKAEIKESGHALIVFTGNR
jgi:AAA domain/DnaB-like helicase N terminal domain